MLLQVLLFWSPRGRFSGRSQEFLVLGQEPKPMACLAEGCALTRPCRAGAHGGAGGAGQRAGRAGQLPASSAACSRQRGAEGPGCAPPLVRLPAFFYLVRDSCSIALTMPLQPVRGFLVFVRAVCVRSFEMALQKMYPIRISSFFLLAFKALWRLFSPYNSAPGTACEQVFICRLVSFASPAFNLCFLPHDLLFCLAALGHHLTSVASHLCCTSACKWTPVLSPFSCCAQAGELLLLPA